VPQKRLSHAIPFDRIDSSGRVDLGRIVIRQKSVALDLPADHHNEYAKCRIRDCETGRWGFRESAGEEVDAFDVAIDLFEFMRHSSLSVSSAKLWGTLIRSMPRKLRRCLAAIARMFHSRGSRLLPHAVDI
jgi:hypothetical protein